jgi:hypothetical protein
MSLVVSLCIYNQHDRSGSIFSFFCFTFVGCHFSFVCGFSGDGWVVCGCGFSICGRSGCSVGLEGVFFCASAFLLLVGSFGVV